MKLLKSIFIFSLLLCSSLLFAAEKKVFAPRYALVIGNSTYEQASLTNPVNDARLIKQKLEDCAFEVSYYENLTNEQLRSAVSEYCNKLTSVSENSVSLLYYSGHGVQIDGQNYMIGTDDANISTESDVSIKCCPINLIWGKKVKAKTHIVIIDACRNNPFASSKEIFSTGLSSIPTPEGVNFTYLFSTQAGKVAEDGKGKNSIFTETLSEEIEKYNISLSTVFSNVCLKVQEKTNNAQRPMYTNSSVNFYFMDESVKDYKIALLQEKLEKLKVEEASQKESKIDYKSELNLIAVQIALEQEQKNKIKADAELKLKDAKEQEEKSKKLAAQSEEIKKQLEQVNKQDLIMKAKKQSSVSLITSMQENMVRVQQIRETALSYIIEADEQVKKDVDAKIAAVYAEDHKTIDYDANGELTSSARKKMEKRIAEINEEGQKQKAANEKKYHDQIREEETELLAEIDKGRKALQKATYYGSSVLDEADFEVVKRYDGEKKQWTIMVYSKLFDNNSLVNTLVELPFASLNKNKKIDYESDEYSDKVDLLDVQLRDPALKNMFDVRFEYTIKPVKGKDSMYSFNASRILIFYNDDFSEEKKEVPDVVKKLSSFPTQIMWNPQTKLKNIAELYADYNKQVALEEKKEAERIRQSEKEALALQKQIEKEAKKAAKANESSFLEKVENWGGSQIPVDGITFGMEKIKYGFSFDIGCNFAINEHLFIGPELFLGNIKLDPAYYDMEEVAQTAYAGIGVNFGANISYNLDNMDYWQLYTVGRFRICSKTGVAFTIMPGAEYVLDHLVVPVAVGFSFGADFATGLGPGYSLSLYTRIPLDEVKDFFEL